MLFHQHHTGAGGIVAVVVGAFEMRVEFEVVDIIFAVTRREADHDLACAQQSQHTKRDLPIVGGDYFDAAFAKPQHGGIVGSDALAAGQRRILVGVDQLHAKIPVQPLELPQHGAQRASGLILLLVEIDHLDAFAEPAHDLARLHRRREGLFAGEIEMGVVAKQRHIGEDRDRHGGDSDKRGRGNAAGKGKPRRHL